MLVLVEDEREKEKLAFVEELPRDCCDICDADRCRTSVLGFLGCERARCGITGASVRVGAGAGFCFCRSARMKWLERWFGAGERDRFGEDSTSGLVGGVVPAVSALSDMSSSDLGDEEVDEADMGWMSGAL